MCLRAVAFGFAPSVSEAFWSVPMRHDFSKALRRLWRACLGGEGAYRPDLHYMRGPGPKWHAKYGGLAAKANAAGGSGGRPHRAHAHRG
ncbi:MAG: hypothetical protein J2P55_12495 [Rhizobiales bacterium]|nr:hypothetical protein [Hyphomicrobiales bacterium]